MAAPDSPQVGTRHASSAMTHVMLQMYDDLFDLDESMIDQISSSDEEDSAMIPPLIDGSDELEAEGSCDGVSCVPYIQSALTSCVHAVTCGVPGIEMIRVEDFVSSVVLKYGDGKVVALPYVAVQNSNTWRWDFFFDPSELCEYVLLRGVRVHCILCIL